MCGRYAITKSPEEVLRWFGIPGTAGLCQQPTSSVAAAVLHRLPPDAPGLYRRRSRSDRSSFTRLQTFCPAETPPTR